MNDLTNKKTMTVKEVAEALGVSRQLVSEKVKMLFPEIVKNGKVTILDEMQVTAIKKEMEKNSYLPQLEKVATDLEMLLLQKKVDLWKDSKIQELQIENNRMKPKAIEHDLFMSNTNGQKIGDVAKMFGIKPNKFHQMLRDAKIMQANHTPYAEYAHQFKVIETPTPAGFNVFTSYILPTGISYICKRFNLQKGEMK